MSNVTSHSELSERSQNFKIIIISYKNFLFDRKLTVGQLTKIGEILGQSKLEIRDEITFKNCQTSNLWRHSEVYQKFM